MLLSCTLTAFVAIETLVQPTLWACQKSVEIALKASLICSSALATSSTTVSLVFLGISDDMVFSSLAVTASVRVDVAPAGIAKGWIKVIHLNAVADLVVLYEPTSVEVLKLFEEP